MAAPHLAGGVALLWQAETSLKGNIDASQQAFELAAQHLTTSQATGFCKGASVRKDNTFGYGLLNLLQAVQSH